MKKLASLFLLFAIMFLIFHDQMTLVSSDKSTIYSLDKSTNTDHNPTLKIHEQLHAYTITFDNVKLSFAHACFPLPSYTPISYKYINLNSLYRPPAA